MLLTGFPLHLIGISTNVSSYKNASTLHEYKKRIQCAHVDSISIEQKMRATLSMTIVVL